MSRVKKYGLDPYTYIKVDLDKEEVTEVAYRCPGKPFETAERMEQIFETILDNALAALDKDEVKKIKKFIKSDAKLRESFKRVFQRELKKIIIYYVKEKK